MSCTECWSLAWHAESSGNPRLSELHPIETNSSKLYQMFFENVSKAASISENNYRNVFETNKNQIAVLNGKVSSFFVKLRRSRLGLWRSTRRLFRTAGEETANVRGPIVIVEHSVGCQPTNEDGNVPRLSSLERDI